MNSSLNEREPVDPYYDIKREQNPTHSISGEGMYCPNEHKLFDPPSGMRNGDKCPLCGERIRV